MYDEVAFFFYLMTGNGALVVEDIDILPFSFSAEVVFTLPPRSCERVTQKVP